MCFFDRAEKPITAVNRTPAPGYHIDLASKPATSQCAPFGSTLPRSSTFKRSISASNSPGPGFYEPSQQQQPLQIELGFQRLKIEAQHKYQSVFKSKIQRFTESATATPGPGSYQASPREKKEPAVSSRKQREDRYKTLINQGEKFIVPSIPETVNKGYRYLGNKLMRIDNEINTEGLGPGFYQLPEQYSNKNGVEWSRTMTSNKPTRKTNFNNLLSQYRGPGRYNPRQAEPRSVLSSFTSRSKRYHQIESSTITPGPGSYQAKQFAQSGSSGDRHFGSKSNRFRTASTDHVNAFPGPGQYFKESQNRTGIEQNQDSNLQKALSEQKIRINEAQTPGPGSYQVSFKNNTQSKKAFSVIMASSSRECKQFSGKKGPGPAKYDTVIKNPSFMKPIRSQSSSLVVRRPEQPEGFQPLYKVQNFTISHKLKMNSHINPETRMSHGFNSGSERFKYSADDNYTRQDRTKEAMQAKLRNQPKKVEKLNSKASFNVSSQRSKRLVNKSPGPGAYDMNLDILKDTFNSKILNARKI